MATIELFLEEPGFMGLFFFVIAQLCMMAAAGIIGYFIGRYGYEETEVAEASRQHGSCQDGIEGRAGMEAEPLLLPGGHVAGDPEPYRADKE